jgi:PAS domain S-box-containing protein
MPSFKALIENSPDAICLVTPAGEVLYASASSAKLLGYLPEELIKRNVFDLFHPEDRSGSLRALREVIAKPPGPLQLEMRIRQKDGQWRWVESTISNLLDEPSVAAIVVNCREIGTRKTAPGEEEQYSQQLAAARADLEDFAYGIAHDLKECLRTISMHSEVLVRETRLDEHGLELARFIISGVRRTSALLEGLHAFAIGAFDNPPQPVNLGVVVTEALQNLGAVIATSEAIVSVDSLPMVQGEEKRLLRVFQNLIANAIKYRSDAPPEIRVTAQRLGQDWIIRVKDNGIGIAKEHHDRVFRLLQRLHGSVTEGAGIGLAICKKIIEALGGTIWVESEPGAGSTFCFTIAAVKEQASLSAPPGNDPSLRTQANGISPALTYVIAQKTGEKRKGIAC